MSDIDMVKKVRVYAEEAEKNGFEVLTVPLRDLFPLLGRMEAAERERDELGDKYQEVSGWYAKMKTRMLSAEAELARRDAAAGERVATHLVYSSVLPKFIGDTDEVESYSCFISGNTPPRKTMEEAYADAYQVCGSLYTAAPPAVLPPEMNPEPEKYDVIDHGFIAGYNQCRADSLALGAQQQKFVELDNVFSINVAGVPVRVILLKDVTITLDAANVKYEVKS